jgi:hypothetical protein
MGYVVGRAAYRENARGEIIGEQAAELLHIGQMAVLSGAGADLFNRVCFTTRLRKPATSSLSAVRDADARSARGDRHEGFATARLKPFGPTGAHTAKDSVLEWSIPIHSIHEQLDGIRSATAEELGSVVGEVTRNVADSERPISQKNRDRVRINRVVGCGNNPERIVRPKATNLVNRFGRCPADAV